MAEGGRNNVVKIPDRTLLVIVALILKDDQIYMTSIGVSLIDDFQLKYIP